MIEIASGDTPCTSCAAGAPLDATGESKLSPSPGATKDGGSAPGIVGFRDRGLGFGDHCTTWPEVKDVVFFFSGVVVAISFENKNIIRNPTQLSPTCTPE